MWDFLGRLFDSGGFPPRWQCGAWTPAHGWLHILSDLGIFAAYFVIPCVLGYYFVRRKGLPFRGVLVLFITFILSCGVTHLMEAVIFWWPGYRLAGGLKLVTAVVSWMTVFALVRVTPQVLSLRSPAELENEIAERKRAEDALRVSEERFRLLVEGVRDYGIFLLTPAGHVASWNDGAERIKGYRADEIVGRHFSAFYPPADADKPARELATAAAAGRVEDEGWRVRKDGSRFWANVVITALRGPDGALVGFSKITRDLTERKRIEEAVAASLREKETLLKEIHHRVKNNLQIVSTLLDLQSGHTTDPAALAMFRESRGRVRSMALVHERLYRTSDLARVNFGEYTRLLAADVFRAYRASDEDVRLTIAAGDALLPLDIAIPCGLLLNELVSNCLKHAFPSGGGDIRIGLTRDDAGTTVLRVADTGIGLPAGVDFRTTPSFGLRLVNTLAEQLNGSVEVRTSGGTEFVVTFPAPAPADRR